MFGETGAGRGVANTIIEKDFWVWWTLKRLFGLPEKGIATLVFKGGTSLSKAFGAIRRFSEDIDLSFHRADLGYIGDRDLRRWLARFEIDDEPEPDAGNTGKFVLPQVLLLTCASYQGADIGWSSYPSCHNRFPAQENISALAPC